MSKGIIFKGNLDEGDYKLIKTTDGWILQGETSYAGFDTDKSQGEWISNHDGSWNCSECGLRVFIYAKGNYCPNCGARMKGADNDISRSHRF